MHKVVEEAIGQAQKRIAEFLLTEEDVVLTEKLLPKAHIWIDNEVNVSWLITSKQDVKDVLRGFAQEGVMLEEFVPSDTTPVWYLKGRNVKIRLCPSWGGVCKLVQVGEEIVTRAKYKLICDDNGEDEKSSFQNSEE